jgi:hypothetical protein
MRIGTILLKNSSILIYFYNGFLAFIKDNSGTSILFSLLQRKQNFEGLLPHTEL